MSDKMTTVETPRGSYRFANEDNYDLTTAEGRIEWFCDHFECELPTLTYDEDEPDQIVLTDELMAWMAREGMSIDWMAGGRVASALGAYRRNFRQEAEWKKAMAHLTDEEMRCFTAGLKAHTEAGVDFQQCLDGIMAVVNERRGSVVQ